MQGAVLADDEIIVDQVPDAGTRLPAGGVVQVATEPLAIVTEEGFLLPPGVEGLSTTTASLVTVFDDGSTCDTSAEDLDVRIRRSAFCFVGSSESSWALFRH